MASPGSVWIRQLSGASLVLPHSDVVRYRCYKRKSVGCTSSALADLRASLATGVYMVPRVHKPILICTLDDTVMVCVCVCVTEGAGESSATIERLSFT